MDVTHLLRRHHVGYQWLFERLITSETSAQRDVPPLSPIAVALSWKEAVDPFVPPSGGVDHLLNPSVGAVSMLSYTSHGAIGSVVRVC